jgi:hypothetical protein
VTMLTRQWNARIGRWGPGRWYPGGRRQVARADRDDRGPTWSDRRRPFSGSGGASASCIRTVSIVAPVAAACANLTARLGSHADHRTARSYQHCTGCSPQSRSPPLPHPAAGRSCLVVAFLPGRLRLLVAFARWCKSSGAASATKLERPANRSTRGARSTARPTSTMAR